jgi:hypothetical protein
MGELFDKVFVGNVPFQCTREEFIECFKNIPGYTNADIIKRYRSKFSRGFGFVEFDNHMCAAELIKEKNIKLKNRVLRFTKYDTLPKQQFPKQQFPKQQFPKQQFLKQQFPKQQFPKQQFPKQQFLKQQFPKQQFPKQLISKTELYDNNIQKPFKSNQIKSKKYNDHQTAYREGFNAGHIVGYQQGYQYGFEMNNKIE